MKSHVIKKVACAVVAMLISTVNAYSVNTDRISKGIDLAGEWRVKLPNGARDGLLTLPGTTDMAGYGYALQKDSLTRDEQFRRLARKNFFIGKATYSKEILIPAEMAGKPLELLLERVLWKSEARIDGIPMESAEYSLTTPHRHVLKQGIEAGMHTIEIDVDNSRQYDISFDNLAHAYTNDTQTIWNGILGSIELNVIPEIDIVSVAVYPDITLMKVNVVVNICNNTADTIIEEIKISIPDNDTVLIKRVSLKPGTNILEEEISARGLGLWNEFNPEVHCLEVAMNSHDKFSTSFGMREVDNKDGIRVNGSPVFLRGSLECCVFPLTGVPPTDAEGWKKTFTVAKQWGLNHFRFHSWCPPEAAFQVADSMGFYLQVELPVWSLKIGDTLEAQQFLKEEYEKIINSYGNHPSFLLMSIGNELQHDFRWLNDMAYMMRKRDPRHLYTTTSFSFEEGHGTHPEPADQYFVTQWTDKGWVRGQGIFEKEPPSFDKNYSSAMQNVNIPLISHEIGQYAVFPNIDEIGKYTGVLVPLNFINVRDDLVKKDLQGKSKDMTLASGRLAALLYKEEIERALKTPGMSGFQLLGLNDFPGQGTALVGLLDAFWDSKGAVDSLWFRQFNSPVVPLLNFGSATYSSDSIFKAQALVANFMNKDLYSPELIWSLTEEGDTIPFAQGSMQVSHMPMGKTTEIGSFSVPLNRITHPSAVIVKLNAGNGFENSWRIHVYPNADIDIGDVTVSDNIEEVLVALENGEKVLFTPSLDKINGLESKFLPVFWSPVHFPEQAGPMGIINDCDHPALKYFPNSGHTDWQWWHPVHRAKILNLDTLTGADPIVGVVDNFVNNRHLAYIFEAQCGKGKLLFSSIDLIGGSCNDMATKALYNSLLMYMNSAEFAPAKSITTAQLQSLIAE